MTQQTDRPSDEVIQSRIRNHLISHLELLVSRKEQEEYQRAVPYVSVYSELFEMWWDWVPYPEEEERLRKFVCDLHDKGVFVKEEIDGLMAFNKQFGLLCDRTPDALSLEEFLELPEWKEMQSHAMDLLKVFRKREYLKKK